MLIAFFIALVLGIAAIYWMILRSSAEKIRAQYTTLAESLSLELNEPAPAMAGFIRPEPSLYGKRNSRELSISVPGKGLQNTRQIETVLKLEQSDQKFAAQFTGSGLLGGFRQRDGRGMTRWKSDEEAFDKAVDVRTNDPARMTRLLIPDFQKSIMAILEKGKGSIYIGGGVIAYAELGLIADVAARERFELVLELFQRLAEAIEAT